MIVSEDTYSVKDLEILCEKLPWFLPYQSACTPKDYSLGVSQKYQSLKSMTCLIQRVSSFSDISAKR